MSTPGPAHQFDSFCANVSECGIPAHDGCQAAFPQVPDGIHYPDGDIQLDDTCVSLDQDAINHLLLSLNECLGPQNFLQLLNSQDPNFAGTNLNHMEASQPSMSSLADPFYNQEPPQDMQDVFLRQVKTEDDSWRASVDAYNSREVARAPHFISGK